MSKALINLNKFIQSPENIDWLDLSNMYFNRREAFNPRFKSHKDLVQINAAKLAEMTAAFAIASPKKLSIHTQHFKQAEYAEVMKAINVEGCRVRTLKLSMNSPMQGSEITAEMMEAIVAGLKSAKQLRSFSLQNHFIGDEAAKVLAAALPQTSIAKLNLSDCGIRKHGLQAILEQVPHTKITSLLMGGTHYNLEQGNGLSGSMNERCTKAALRAADEGCLIELRLPKDEFVFNANNRLRNGPKSWGVSYKNSLQLAKDINNAQERIAARRLYVESLAFSLFGKSRPLSSEWVDFLKRGGDEAVRSELKGILSCRHRPTNVEPELERHMQELSNRIG